MKDKILTFGRSDLVKILAMLAIHSLCPVPLM